ncbi:gram-negative bacteria-binding protein 3 [Episyrphus balteatus]|uniref:gram-negative bacteria-binding protein 3 n=1 Tax=Episyrphus balteatus TaxID=286459 RepID=UPI0024858CC1|nr:gram-negative bacteria-binding protein 3 [Episyrphus balteatus]
MTKILILSALLIVATTATLGYEVPKAEFKIFYPKGFEVSIPAEEGATLFAFHGKLNEEMDGLEAGRWARDILKPKNGRYIFKDRETSLKLGDTIYYWTYVIYNGLGYREDDGVYVVTAYENDSGSKTPPVTPPPSQPSGSEDPSCRSSVTRMNNDLPVRCAGQILFEEDFNSNNLDSAKWMMERRFTTQPDHEFVVYLLNSDVLKIRNSVAKIKPISTTSVYGDNFLRREFNLGTNCTGIIDTEDCSRAARTYDILPPFISSQFSTKNSFTFKYGRVEIRAKMPNAPWVFPQLFLDPVNTRYGSKNYQSGQMRVALSRSSGGDLANELFGGVIINAEEPFRNEKMCKRSGSPIDWSADFHVFTLEWLPSKIVVSVDTEEYCTIETPENGFSNLQVDGKSLPNKEYLETGSKMAPFDQEFYIRLGYGIGGHKDFPDDTTLWLKEKPWRNGHPKAMKHFWDKNKRNLNQWLGPSAALEIDYVKVFAV